MPLQEGQLAPNFKAQCTSGKEVSLDDYKGKNVVLYFYPKDDTPGCTIEAKDFTVQLGIFTDNNTAVLGVSYDDISCHKNFIDKYDLKIQLIADTSKEIAKAYESAGEKYCQRNTFLIDTEGKIKKIFRDVNPKGHAEEVIKALNA